MTKPKEQDSDIDGGHRVGPAENVCGSQSNRSLVTLRLSVFRVDLPDQRAMTMFSLFIRFL